MDKKWSEFSFNVAQYHDLIDRIDHMKRMMELPFDVLRNSRLVNKVVFSGLNQYQKEYVWKVIQDGEYCIIDLILEATIEALTVEQNRVFQKILQYEGGKELAQYEIRVEEGGNLLN